MGVLRTTRNRNTTKKKNGRKVDRWGDRKGRFKKNRDESKKALYPCQPGRYKGERLIRLPNPTRAERTPDRTPRKGRTFRQVCIKLRKGKRQFPEKPGLFLNSKGCQRRKSAPFPSGSLSKRPKKGAVQEKTNATHVAKRGGQKKKQRILEKNKVI